MSKKTREEIYASAISLLYIKFHSKESGLSSKQADSNRREFGENYISSQTVSPLEVFFRQFKSSFVYLLLAAAGIAFFLGEYPDAGMIFFFLVLNAMLGFWQEYKAEHSLELLKNFIERTTRVRRNGKIEVVSVKEVVVGDVVVLEAGDMIPADGKFIKAEFVTIDESTFSGESLPVKKCANGENRDNSEIGFSRTTLLSGDAELLVCAVGVNTEVGDIALHIEKAESPSAFQEGIGKFSAFVLKLVLGTIPLVFALNALIHHETIDYGEFLIFSIALTVSVIPEALPLVTTLSLSQGALHLARKQVVPRRLTAIEDLGSIDVLCSDKTGTITENRLSVGEIFGKRNEVMEYALAPTLLNREKGGEQNAVFDHALLSIAHANEKQFALSSVFLDEEPFDPIRKRDTVLVEHRGRKMLITRGAPECFSVQHNADIETWIKQEGEKGRRVIAIGHYDLGETGKITLDPDDEERIGFVGMISFGDPLKVSTKDAVLHAKKLGVQVKIITGDRAEVAGWVGKEAGILKDQADVMLGDDFEKLSDNDKEFAVERFNVFARTSPNQKFEIIKALERKHLVGFLGEGFNDAPALKMAHVGLAVSNASDIAQDASDVVLLNPSLEVIIDGIKEGRKIFANSMKYLRATLTSNFGNFYALALSSLFVPFLPMLPIQVLLLNLLSDFPMISIASDTVDEHELEKPKGYEVREITAIAVVLGIVSTIFDFTFFGYFVRFENPAVLQTMWFMGSILTELILLFSIRTALPFWKASRPSAVLCTLTGVAAVLTIAVPFVTPAREIFGFVIPEKEHLLMVFFLVLLYFVSTEVVKLLFHRYWNNKKAISFTQY